MIVVIVPADSPKNVLISSSVTGTGSGRMYIVQGCRFGPVGGVCAPVLRPSWDLTLSRFESDGLADSLPSSGSDAFSPTAGDAFPVPGAVPPSLFSSIEPLFPRFAAPLGVPGLVPGAGVVGLVPGADPAAGAGVAGLVPGADAAPAGAGVPGLVPGADLSALLRGGAGEAAAVGGLVALAVVLAAIPCWAVWLFLR